MSAELTSACQAYLEAIYCLERDRGSARVRDLAQMLDVHKSTVTGALRRLAREGLIRYEPYEPVTLTPKGRQVAGRVNERHGVVSRFLVEVLGVDPEVAERGACRLQAAMSGEVLDRMICLLASLDRHPRIRKRWLGMFRRFAEETWPEQSREEWIRQCLHEADGGPGAVDARPENVRE